MLDDLVPEDALVRVLDAWVDSLEMGSLGFAKAQAGVLGRPPYDPADLLKLYLFGYLNGIRSSRALERECRRNVECLWLLGRLAPDHKTIAEFRRHHPDALVAVCAAFVQFARREQLIAGAIVALDGSKIRAVASKKAIGKAEDVTREQQRLVQEVEQYLHQLDAADRQESPDQPRKNALRRTLARLRERQKEVESEAERLATTEATLSVQTEPQARAMKGLHGAPGYNLQTAVDAGSHLIVHHAVCNDTSDANQLAPMAQGVAQILEAAPAIVADAGYANGEQLHQLEELGVTGYVAPLRAVNNQGGGILYDRSAFAYDAARDGFVCPANKVLKRKQVCSKDKLVIYAADARDCTGCAQKDQCTRARQRFVSRHWYEEALDANAKRVAASPEMMALRRQTVEHPFGTIKHRILGNARLLVRGLRGARAELSLAVLAYNFKRVINLKGGTWMLQALRA
jgi:transposase